MDKNKQEIKTTWQASLDEPIRYEELRHNKSADVIVIGGGITGATTAYLLARAGKKVILLDAGNILRSVTARTTAFITSIIDTDLSDLVFMMGHEEAKKVILSGEAAINEIEEIVRREQIDCEFMRTSNCSITFKKRGRKKLEKNARILESFGLSASFHQSGKFSFAHEGFMMMQNQAKFHPLKYVSGLRRAIIKYGGEIYEEND